ncbi:hypothetical protein [Paenibacillus glycanilyticus]|uniref:DUF1450 domain-containing protein n=1 Tax=Paenibacillus glycanilyticus TaxID=126569 RepID=A0ABQ6G475_9BACL|nr:hypothetical protein [Paenibacillus glycanilyticus]GLX65759.1 hypothetical protein MU1_01030 [Paenibacillus glycanilyticus]
MNGNPGQSGSLRFCVNNYSRHAGTLSWMTHYKSLGWDVQLVGCMGQCSTCRAEPMFLQNEDWEPITPGASAECMKQR